MVFLAFIRVLGSFRHCFRCPKDTRKLIEVALNNGSLCFHKSLNTRTFQKLLLFSYINRLKTPDFGYFKNNICEILRKIVKQAYSKIKNVALNRLIDGFSS